VVDGGREGGGDEGRGGHGYVKRSPCVKRSPFVKRNPFK
jgi:hypothetical protein